MPSFIDRTGTQYGRLTALKLDPEKSTKKRKYWICECLCGNTKSILADNLQSGKTISCGCYSLEMTPVRAVSRTRWGKDLAATRHVWRLMLRRCKNPKDGVYEYYGGRGISVCDEWKDFDKFLKDMGVKPEGYSLERKNVNGNYCLENCCWVTQKEQARNRTNTKWISIGGDTKSAAEWCEIYDCNQGLFSARLSRNWDPLKALTTPPRPISQDWRHRNP